MYKPLLIALGFICIGLAVLGIVLPLLPTTPFLLLAAACFAKSSKKLHDWLLRNKTFGPLIKQWQETRSMTRKTKVYALISVFVVGGTSFISLNTFIMRLILIAALVLPVVIILKIKTTESL
ncbi:MAG: YbaN family protein [Nitrospirae bacterium]|nr:YbaN family protein [Nitrospirota bacterium]